jgi:hypothetical protein
VALALPDGCDVAGRCSLTPVILGHALTDLVIEPWIMLGAFGALS